MNKLIWLPNGGLLVVNLVKKLTTKKPLVSNQNDLFMNFINISFDYRLERFLDTDQGELTNQKHEVGNHNDLFMHSLAESCNGQVTTEGWEWTSFVLGICIPKH